MVRNRTYGQALIYNFNSEEENLENFKGGLKDENKIAESEQIINGLIFENRFLSFNFPTRPYL